MEKIDLHTELNRLFTQEAVKEDDYYQMDLFADEEGKYTHSIYSHWIGFDEDNPKIEIREPSIMDVDVIRKFFDDMNEPLLIINDDKDVFLFFSIFGGHGLVKKELCEKYINHLVQPQKSVFTYYKGRINADDIPEKSFNRAADPKLRMRIFKRDNRRCRICGASPQNNEHVELHLHHITLYSEGGLTDENNLITVCHTCHKGLEPHFDFSLYSILGINTIFDPTPTEDYIKKIERNIQYGLKKIQEIQSGNQTLK